MNEMSQRSIAPCTIGSRMSGSRLKRRTARSAASAGIHGARAAGATQRSKRATGAAVRRSKSSQPRA